MSRPLSEPLLHTPVYSRQQRQQRQQFLTHNGRLTSQPPIAPFSGLSAGVYRYNCMFCDASFFSRGDLFKHKARTHRRQFGGADLQDRPFPEGEDPFSFSPDTVELNQIYSDNEIYILEPHRLDDDIFLTFNFPIQGTVTNNLITTQMEQIYEDPATTGAYKLQISAGVLLQNNKDKTFRYFRPEANAYLLDTALIIDDREALEESVKYIHSMNMDELIRNFRPATSYQVIYITQLTYHIWLTDFPLGVSRRRVRHALPQYITSCKSVITNVDNRGFENCCIFISLAQYLLKRGGRDQDSRTYKQRTKELLSQWYLYCMEKGIKGYPVSSPAAFKGLKWRDLPHFEILFEVNVCIMEKVSDGSAITRYTSLAKHSKTLYLNIYEDHMSWIKNVDQYTRRFKCKHCFRMYKKRSKLIQHQKKCILMTRYICPTSAYRYHQSLFEQLECIGVVIPMHKRWYSHFATFDLEAILAVCNRVSKSGRTTFYNQHLPISCAIASNCEPYDSGVCYVNENPDELVELMFQRFSLIREQALEKAREKWGEYLEVLQSKMQTRLDELKPIFLANDDVENLSEQDGKLTVRQRLLQYCEADYMFKLLCSLYKQLKLYMQKLVLLTFHGQGYDLHLLTSSLAKYFLRQEAQTRKEALSGRTVTATAHESSELSQDWSESESDNESDNESDVESCSDAESSGSFEYDSEKEYEELLGGGGNDGGEPVAGEDCDLANFTLDAADIIARMHLDSPGYYRVLRRLGSYVSMSNNQFVTLDVCNWLSPGTSYRKFLIAYNARERKSFFPFESLNSYQALSNPIPPYPSQGWNSDLRGGADMLHAEYVAWESGGSSGPPPLTGQQNYDELMNVCERHNIDTLKKLLCHYNLLDVSPFVEAVQNMQEEYFAQELDIWRVSVGTPGLARIKMMKAAQRNNVIFPLFDKNNLDLYFMFRTNSVGGPSIVHTRRLICGTSYLRPDGKFMCNSISGYDCNSMYLAVLKHQMPTTMFVRRHESEHYKPQYRRNYFKMIVWLNDVQRRTGDFVRSRATNGHECRVRGYYLDGLIVKANGQLLALEFNGCHHHRHRVIKATCPNDRQEGVSADAYEKWVKKRDFLVKQGYQVECKWECEFDSEMRDRPELRQELNDMKPPFLRRNPKTVTQAQILNAVYQGGLFGFVLCDLYTPKEVQERLDVLPPIFANHSVSMEHLGPIMREYAEGAGIKVENRRLLLSAYAAREILLSARLLQYYMKLGLIVTRVYQVIEFTPRTPFVEFVEEVTRRRQEASQNPDRKIIGEIHKLIGNCAYGSTMLDKMKYTRVSYVEGLHAAKLAVNDSTFKCLRPIGDQTFELEFGYKKIELNVPVYVATNILNEAKLALLSYCYDFLMYFIRVDHFNIAFLDTDSIYCGYHSKSLEDSVMPEKREEFNHRIYGFCGDARHPQAVLPRKCCLPHNQADQKWPLLWKCEKSDIKSVYALCSKTYICIDNQKGFKISAKGANKSQVAQNDPAKMFKDVFETRKPASVKNRGFQNVKGNMYTYVSERFAFPWLYVKRQVITSCGSYTRAIPNLVLDPSPLHHHCIQTLSPELECDDIAPFMYQDYIFQTIRQAHCYSKYFYCVNYNVPPMESSIRLLARIMRTEKQAELLEIEKTLGECDKFSLEEFDVVYYITCARMSRHPQLYGTLHKVRNDYIVNATRCDARLGSGCSPGIARWEKGAYLRGANIYGKVLMTILIEIKQMLKE